MKILSLNVGMPRDVRWHGREVTTGIFKDPVAGRIPLRQFNLDGDRQADLSVHGGTYKAVYCYPNEHYPFWKRELPDHKDLPYGMFGENFTTEGLLEHDVHVGDHFSVGSAEVVVTQPRMPCYKLGIKFQSDQMVKRFLASRRSGFYLAVVREGDVGVGDELTPVSRNSAAISISDILRLYVAKTYTAADVTAMQKALGIDAFPDSWKEYFRERLSQVST